MSISSMQRRFKMKLTNWLSCVSLHVIFVYLVHLTFWNIKKLRIFKEQVIPNAAMTAVC